MAETRKRERDLRRVGYLPEPRDVHFDRGLFVATWQQVKSYIYTNYNVNTDEGNNMSLNFETSPGRSQMLFIAHIEADEFSAVLFSSPFATWSQVSGDRALRATEQVSAGIRSIGDYLVVTHSQLLATIDEPEIDLSMVLVVNQADQLEAVLGLGDQF